LTDFIAELLTTTFWKWGLFEACAPRYGALIVIQCALCCRAGDQNERLTFKNFTIFYSVFTVPFQRKDGTGVFCQAAFLEFG